ncbi:MAG: response regulator [Phycisphaerae bacterium]|nr:response regulator [Phycisphaerae bacterium]
MKILIVDDQHIVRLCLKNDLKGMGYKVFEAEDGRSAWKMIRTVRPDIAIVDWMMPEINGIDLCKLIRKQKDLPYVYVIMITGKSGNVDMIHGLEAGADDFITKPCARDVLRSRVSVGTRIVKYERNLFAKNTLLEKYNQRMQTLVHERTKQLSQIESIAHSGNLCIDIVNEIDNPMAFISGNIHMLGRIWQDMEPQLQKQLVINDENIDADKVNFVISNFPQILEGIHKGVKRVNNIVKGLKKFCYKDNSKPEPCNLNDCIEHSLSLCNNVLQYHIEVVKELDDSLQQVLADTFQIEQVFINLFDNATDAMRTKGKGILKVNTKANGDYATITISDTGIGLSEESGLTADQPTPSNNSVDIDVGLNLPIVAGIIKKYRGHIKAENKPTGGAVFMIDLPVIKVNNQM